jgi:PAS domain S-box-containing protein
MNKISEYKKLIPVFITAMLFAFGLVSWYYADLSVGQKWSLFAFWAIPAAGSVLMIWFLLRFVSSVRNITKRLNGKQDLMAVSSYNPITRELKRAIRNHFEQQDIEINSMKQNVESLRIQLQINKRQKKNTETIIYSIQDVVIVDEFGKLLIANEAAEKVFGFNFEESQYKPVEEVIPAENKEFVDLMQRCRKSKVKATRRQMEFVVDDYPRTFDCIFSSITDEKGEISGIVAVLHDITREKEISRMKNDFVSHVSHELKTPLASIMAYSEMLADGDADDEKSIAEFCSVIQNQSKRLNRLIEDILNVSRIESGLVKVNKKPVSLPLIIEEQANMIKSYAEEKNITVEGIKAGDVVVFGQIDADKDMISQVVVNLLSNAVKYTPSGGKVTVNTDIDENEGLARVSITDTGVGIPPEEVEHVFDKFYRVATNKKQAKGTGLGLNLVKQIVEKVHGGRVFVTSEVGKGSTFGFELPLASVEANQV